MLPSIEYIKTLTNGLKQWVENRVKTVRKEINELPRPDWTQNDPAAKDYVKNRTHWVEKSAEEKSYSFGVSFGHHQDGATYFTPFSDYNYTLPLELGKKATVKATGGSESSWLKEVTQDSNGNPMLDLSSELTLRIFSDKAIYSGDWVSQSGTNTIEVTIEETIETIHKIDEKFLPDYPSILSSSTPGSTKQFKITVDDSGTISATEVTS